MISIKRFLDQRHAGTAPERDLTDALSEMGRLLLDAMATHVVPGNDADRKLFRQTLKGLAGKMDGPQSAMSVLGISSDAVEALETYCHNTAEYHREQHAERQSMVAMLTETVADLAGQTDASVTRLQSIEKQVERASELDDIKALRALLGDSLQALREAAVEQRNKSAAAIERLQGQLAMARRGAAGDSRSPAYDRSGTDLIDECAVRPAESHSASYVAAVRLRRGEDIASRFGEEVRHRMLAIIATQLKIMLGPSDRLLRWKGTSFVMFINSIESIKQLRARFAETIATTSQQYIEAGSKTSLLSVGVDWIVFAQEDHSSLEAAFAEVDMFLASSGKAAPGEAIPR
ncbi:MAG: diguanylate cyclase [Bryobacteraceae bacterium]|jgi:GGDEF domain-containing protein